MARYGPRHTLVQLRTRRALHRSALCSAFAAFHHLVALGCSLPRRSSYALLHVTMPTTFLRSGQAPLLLSLWLVPSTIVRRAPTATCAQAQAPSYYRATRMLARVLDARRVFDGMAHGTPASNAWLPFTCSCPLSRAGTLPLLASCSMQCDQEFMSWNTVRYGCIVCVSTNARIHPSFLERLHT